MGPEEEANVSLASGSSLDSAIVQSEPRSTGARHPRLVWAVLASVLAVTSVAPGIAAAYDGPTCAAAYEDNQIQRKKFALRAAREKLLVCVDETCPSVIRSQCADWLREVEQSIPTVTFAALDESGAEISDVTVLFDDVILKEGLDGKAVAVDPGKHTFKFVAGDRAPIEQELTVREGEKSRIVKVSWEGKTPPGDGSGGGDVEPPGTEGGGASVHPATWILGGVGVVGMGLFATFGIIGLNEKADASAENGGCEPNCTEDVVDSIRTKFIVADVSLGIGVASLVGAGIVAIVSLSSGSSSAQKPLPVAVSPLPGGAYVSAGGTF